MTANSECSWLRMSLGVYVLGAIDPAERAEVDRHLSGCERCRGELASLAGLPAMLSRVSEEQVERLGPPPEELFESILARAGRERRTRHRWSVVWHVAAAVALVVATGAGMGLVTGDEGRPAPRPSATAPPQTGQALAGEDPVTGVRAQVRLLPKRWGTALDMRLTGAPRGAHCQMIVVDRNGRRDIAGAWAVPYAAREGGPAEYFGSSMIFSDQVASIEVRTVDGRRLVRVPV